MTEKKPAKRITLQKICCYQWVKTLASDDPDYVPFYDNENQSNNYKIAQGFSYHQGPEWVWPYGYYL